MSHRTAIVIFTIDPTSPSQTVIGYDASFNNPTYSPIGCGGGGVLAAILKGNFHIEKIEAGNDFVNYTLRNKHYDRKDQERLESAFEDMDCEPIT